MGGWACTALILREEGGSLPFPMSLSLNEEAGDALRAYGQMALPLRR